jgi:TPR repeat protein
MRVKLFCKSPLSRVLGPALCAALLGLAPAAGAGDEAAAGAAAAPAEAKVAGEPAKPAGDPVGAEIEPAKPEAAGERPEAPRDPSDPEAQFERGVQHLLGRGGVPKNEVEAVRWFRKAAEQGHARAQTQMAMAYQRGRGVPRDEQLSLEWMNKAAEQNQPKAQFELAVAHRDGKGVPKDPVRAGMWFVLASQSGGMAAKMIGSSHMRTLSQPQRKEAFELAQMWRVERGLPRIGSAEAKPAAQTDAGASDTGPVEGTSDGAEAAQGGSAGGGAAQGGSAGGGAAQGGSAGGGTPGTGDAPPVEPAAGEAPRAGEAGAADPNAATRAVPASSPGDARRGAAAGG